MKPGDKAKRLRIYLSSTDKLGHTPLYESVVFAARENGIAGVTVIKGVMGYGASSEIYSDKVWEITEKVPLIIEIIDLAEKIDTFQEIIRSFFDRSGKGHMITIEETIILVHRTGLKNNSI